MIDSWVLAGLAPDVVNVAHFFSTPEKQMTWEDLLPASPSAWRASCSLTV